MSIPIIIAVIGSVVFLLLLGKLVQRNRLTSREWNGLALPGSADTDLFESFSDDWFEEFSSFRYLPMRRLLSESEEEFWLRSTEGGESNLRAFRTERRRLFREYLRLVASDFGRLSQGARMSIVSASQDQAAEIKQLISLEWTFRKLLWQANLRLSLHWAGVRPMDATALINAMQSLEFSLREVRLGQSAA